MDDAQELAVWAHGCASRVLDVFWQARPADARVTEALDGVAAFAAGARSAADLLPLALACSAAAADAERDGQAAAAQAALAVAAAAQIPSDSSAAATVRVHCLRGISLSAGVSEAEREDARMRASLPRRFTATVHRAPARSVDLRTVQVQLPDTAPVLDETR